MNFSPFCQTRRRRSWFLGTNSKTTQASRTPASLITSFVSATRGHYLPGCQRRAQSGATGLVFNYRQSADAQTNTLLVSVSPAAGKAKRCLL